MTDWKERYEKTCRQITVKEPAPDKGEMECSWTFDDIDCYYETSCGETWSFIDGNMKENGVKFCHCCGKKAREVSDEKTNR